MAEGPHRTDTLSPPMQRTTAARSGSRTPSLRSSPMIQAPAARVAVAVVIVASVAGAAVRVATAPDRVKERRDTARAACTGAGGEWVRLGNDEACRAPDPAK